MKPFSQSLDPSKDLSCITRYFSILDKDEVPVMINI